MDSRSQHTDRSRRLLLFLAAVIAALAAISGFTTASASASPAAEIRVGALTVASAVVVGPPEHITPGQQLENHATAPDFVVATGVAAKADTLLSTGGGTARLPMNMGTVNGVASKYRIAIDDLTIRINKSKAGIRGSTAPNGCITLCRGAFESEGQLAKTLVHERVHVEDLRAGMPYPRGYDAQSAAEVRAETIANDWWSRQ